MKKHLEQIKQLLGKCQGSWGWVGQRGLDAYAVLDLVPVDAVFCCDFGERYHELWAKEALFSVEKEIGRRESWGNQDLETLWEGPARQHMEEHIGKLKTPINTVCYRSLAVLEKDDRFRVLAPSLALKDMFDDKLQQLKLFSKLGVKTPKTHVCCLDEITFAEVQSHMGGPFVVQSPVGSSGDNTYFIKNAADFEEVRAVLDGSKPVKLSKYIPVPSLNGHGVVLKTPYGPQSIAVCPSVQIVGIPECTHRAEVYCGNDFAAAGRVAESVRDEICAIVERVGLFMGRQGFFGIFGMDFLLSKNQVLALEINPRFQGSTMLLSLLQIERGEIPLAALHVLQFMNLLPELPPNILEQLKKAYRQPYPGAHLIVHSLKDQPLKVEHDLQAGVHRLVNDSIVRVRNGITYRDLEKPDEWCIIGNLPLSATEVRREARLAMIHSGRSILDNNLQQLEFHAATFVKALQRRFRMIPL